MYSPKPHRKARTGSVQVRSSNNRLQLVFTFGGKRHFISTRLGETPFNRKQAQDKALDVERDIAYGEFDPDHLEKYKAQSALATDDTTPPNSAESLDLAEIWNRYRQVRSSGKSVSTIRMYGWVANHINLSLHKGGARPHYCCLQSGSPLREIHSACRIPIFHGMPTF